MHLTGHNYILDANRTSVIGRKKWTLDNVTLTSLTVELNLGIYCGLVLIFVVDRDKKLDCEYVCQETTNLLVKLRNKIQTNKYDTGRQACCHCNTLFIDLVCVDGVWCLRLMHKLHTKLTNSSVVCLGGHKLIKRHIFFDIIAKHKTSLHVALKVNCECQKRSIMT